MSATHEAPTKWKRRALLATAVSLTLGFPVAAQTLSTSPTLKRSTPTARSIPKLAVKLHLPGISSPPHGTVHVVAFAANAAGGRVAGLPLRFHWGTGGCNATTDSSGRASCYTAARTGVRPLEVTFEGNSEYTAAQATATITSNGYGSSQGWASEMRVRVEGVTGRKSGTAYLRARVTRNYVAIRGQKVNFFAGGRYVGSALTNTEGYAHRQISGTAPDLQRFTTDADVQNGQLEASLPTGPPALHVGQLSLLYKPPELCDANPNPITDAPSFVPISKRKCQVRQTVSTRVSPTPTVGLKVFRHHKDSMQTVSTGGTTISVDVPPRPARNAGCDPNARLGGVCTPQCVRVEYLRLNGHSLHRDARLVGLSSCQPSKSGSFSTLFSWFASDRVREMAWDRCADTAPTGLSPGAGWSHTTTLTIPFAVAPVYVFTDGYMSADKNHVWETTQEIVDQPGIVNASATVTCR